jgi:hypothetical protein
MAFLGFSISILHFKWKSAAPGETEGNFKFLQGTGKWKGIKGSGKGKVITRGKPITPGTAQVCSRWTGTFELPK